MTSVDPRSSSVGSQVFNPSPRLRTLLAEARGGGNEAHRSDWSRAAEELLAPRDSSNGGPLGGGDIAPLWLIEPQDPGLRSTVGEPLGAQLLAHVQRAEGPWPQRLLPSDGTLHCLYVTPAHSASADGFYLPNGGLLIARPAERFRVSRTNVQAAGKPPHRLPSPMEVWRHRLFARTVAAPSHGLCSKGTDLKEAIVTLAAERWGPLRPWPPTRALPGAEFDHRAVGFYALLVTIVAALNLVTGQASGFLAAASMLVVAACVMYGIRPALTSQERASGVLLSVARFCTYLAVMLALLAQVALRPDPSFFWVYTIPLVALVAAGPRRAVAWLALLALSAGQYGAMTIVR